MIFKENPFRPQSTPRAADIEDELRQYAKEQLTGYKCPKIYEFRTELPKTNVGKILRRELRESESASKAAEQAV